VTGRWTAVALAAAVVLGAVGCAASEDPLPFGLWCDGDRRADATIVLSVQSVPTTTRFVCFEFMPPGWTAAMTHIGDTGTEVTLDHDRGGEGALRLWLLDECDASGVRINGSVSGVHSSERVEETGSRYRATRYDRFRGGCVVAEFDLDRDAVWARAAIEAAIRIVPVSRSAITRETVR
jgi:hypothetical protein